MSINKGRVLVAVATYKRPDGLRRLLRSISELDTSIPFDVAVVDNDPALSAREIADEYPHVLFLSEGQPGIAAARNRALAEAAGFEYVAFVDDDETVHKDWLDSLLSMAQSRPCAAVTGPKVPVYGPDTPLSLIEDGFFSAKRLANGLELVTCSTANVLISVEALARLNPPQFSKEFGLTGGSDTELFTRMHEEGGILLWADGAVVYDYVDPNRMNWKWIFSRLIRYGNVDGRLMVERRGRLTTFAAGMIRLFVGTLRILLGVLRYRKFKSSYGATFFRGIGMARASWGDISIEYKRD